MNKITHKEDFIKNELDYNNLIESIINTSLKYKYISHSEYQQITLKVMDLLLFTTKRYTGCLTNSVTIQTLKNINESNLFIIGLYLKEKSIKEIINILLLYDIKEIYDYSKKNISIIFEKTKLFYKTIFINNLITTENYFYNSTLKEGILSFFKMYNYDYDSKNIFITADYEPYLERPKLCGIEFIKQYLEYINYENIFCNKFSKEKIENLLNNIFDNYIDLPINIFEVVLTTAIILKYLDKDIFSLNILDINVNTLYNDYNLDDKTYIENLEYSLNEIKSILNLNSSVNNYIDNSFNKILKKLLYYTKENHLDILFRKNLKNVINYEANTRLSDKEYVKILENLKMANSCEKVYIFKNYITSLYDFVDILDLIELTKKELFQIFSNLKLIELIVLKKYLTEFESKYLEILNEYISSMDIRKQSVINNNYELVIFKP